MELLALAANCKKCKKPRSMVEDQVERNRL
jgi:hypothetical protein